MREKNSFYVSEVPEEKGLSVLFWDFSHRMTDAPRHGLLNPQLQQRRFVSRARLPSPSERQKWI